MYKYIYTRIIFKYIENELSDIVKGQVQRIRWIKKWSFTTISIKPNIIKYFKMEG